MVLRQLSELDQSNVGTEQGQRVPETPTVGDAASGRVHCSKYYVTFRDEIEQH